MNHLHQFLIDLGFEHTHVEASWHDDGDAENGPHLSGGPAYDEYIAPDEWIIVDHNGRTHLLDPSY